MPDQSDANNDQSEDPSLRAIYNVLSSQPNGGTLSGYFEQARNGVMADAVDQGYNPDDDRAMRMVLERSARGQPPPAVRRVSSGAGAFVQRTPTGNGLLSPGSTVNLGLPRGMADRTSSLPVAIARHEGEHTRQGAVSIDAHRMGVDEVGPKLGDIIAQAQAFKDQTGRPLQTALSNPAGSYTPSVEWMRRQALRHGMQTRSIDQLLATREGQAWIRKMIEGSEHLNMSGPNDGASDPRNRFSQFTNDMLKEAHTAAGRKNFPHPVAFRVGQLALGREQQQLDPTTFANEDKGDFARLAERAPGGSYGDALRIFSKTKFYRRLANRFLYSPEGIHTPERESFHAADFYFPRIPQSDQGLFLQTLATASRELKTPRRRRLGDRAAAGPAPKDLSPPQ